MANKRKAVVSGAAVKSKITRKEADNPTDNQFEDYENYFRHCSKHKLEIRLFCETHKAQLCKSCVKDGMHGDCTVISLSKTYFTFHKYLEQIKHTRFVVDIMDRNLESYRNKLDIDQKSSEKLIMDTYREVHEKINELEQTSLKELEDLVGKEQNKISNNSSSLKILRNRLGNVIEECQQTDHPTDYLKSTSTLQGSVRSAGKELKKIQDSSREVTIDVKKNVRFTNKLQKHPSAVLRVVSSGQKSLYKTDTLLTLSNPFDFITGYYCKGHRSNSICMVPNTDSEMLLATYEPNILQHIKVRGEVIKIVELSDKPGDVCIYDSLVAVPLTTSARLNIYNISDFSKHDHLDTPGLCHSVCRLKDTFYVAFTRKKVIKRISDKGEELCSSEKIFRDPSIVRGLNSGDGVLVSDPSGFRLVALSSDLASQLYEISFGCNIPRGFCFNNHGGMYVCNVSNSTIREYNKDGKYVATILDDRNGVKNPLSICYDTENEVLAVGCVLYNELLIFNGS